MFSGKLWSQETNISWPAYYYFITLLLLIMKITSSLQYLFICFTFQIYNSWVDHMNLREIMVHVSVKLFETNGRPYLIFAVKRRYAAFQSLILMAEKGNKLDKVEICELREVWRWNPCAYCERTQSHLALIYTPSSTLITRNFGGGYNIFF